MIDFYQKSVEDLMKEFHPDVNCSNQDWFYRLYIDRTDTFIKVLETLERYGKQDLIREEIKKYTLLDDYYEYLLISPSEVNKDLLQYLHKYEKDKYEEYHSKLIKHNDEIDELTEIFDLATYS